MSDDLDRYYKEFLEKGVKNKDILKNLKLHNLFKKPVKDKGLNEPHQISVIPNSIHQADLLSLPNDNGYKYALVVVDVHDSRVDARPLKSKKADEIISAFKEIYQGGRGFEYPHQIVVDSGSEFKGKVAKFFKDNKVDVRTALPGRHRQVAKAERKNQQIGTMIFKRITAQALLTGKTDNHWVDDLPIYLDALNRYTSPIKEENIPEHSVCKGSSCDIIPVGTKVRVILDQPQAPFPIYKQLASGKWRKVSNKLPGPAKFRSSDIRWDPQIREIDNVLLLPGRPPLYTIKGLKRVAYTKNQLQIVPDIELNPPTSVIRGKPERFVISKVLKIKQYDDKTYYHVLWANGEKTWEEEKKLISKAPELMDLIDK